jgi:DNA-binding response OmpR family regulator
MAMNSLVYLTTRSPSKLGDELTRAGYRVFEALAISEVLYLQEHENVDLVIIDSTVQGAEEKARHLRGITFTLDAAATTADVQWELSLLFPDVDGSVQ